MRHDRLVRLAVAAIAALACAIPAIASAATHEPMRNHITLGFGYGQHLSDEFDGSDLESGGLGQLAYRYSLNKSVDLCVEARSFMASDEAQLGIGGTFYDVDVSHDTSWFGPGVRWSSGEGGVRPFLQANVYFVQASTTIEIANVSEEETSDGAGFGLAGGADIRLSRLLSLPLELSYLYGKPGDPDEWLLGLSSDVSSLGLSVGLTFNFTPLP